MEILLEKKLVYLDSTIPSYYFDERESVLNFIDATRSWWDSERSKYRLYASEITLAEIQNGDYPNKKRVFDLMKGVNLLALNKTIEDVALVYGKEFVMPSRNKGDAYHLAMASYYKIDFLLTWNCEHLANANKSMHIAAVNMRLGLFVPAIVTPLQLISEGPGGES